MYLPDALNPSTQLKQSGSLHFWDTQVHVFWDVEAHHPGRADPRVLAHHIRTFASCYGQVGLPDAVHRAAVVAATVVRPCLQFPLLRCSATLPMPYAMASKSSACLATDYRGERMVARRL